jgi:hypothetical protein
MEWPQKRAVADPDRFFNQRLMIAPQSRDKHRLLRVNDKKKLADWQNQI